MKALLINQIELNHFNRDKNSLQICKEVNLSFNKGEVIGVIGPNGSGKTTFLKSLIGTKNLASGSISLNGQSIDTVRNQGKIAYIPQNIENSFFSWMSVKKNLMTVLTSAKNNKNILKQLWEEFDIRFSFENRPKNCSGGMLQQAAVVRSFMNSPELIVADEPFSALDVQVAEKIRKTFRNKVKSSQAVAIVAMHNLDDILAVCDKVILITNKPYTSIEENGYHRLMIYKNDNVGDIGSSPEKSLALTVNKLFTPYEIQ